MRPVARHDDLIIRELPDEVLVYDTRRNRAHCLNKAAAAVWQHCDGQRTVADLTATLHAKLQLPDNDQLIHLALEQLSRADLLEEAWAGTPAPEGRGSSRRDWLVRLGVSLAAIPAIMSIAAPRAMAQSSRPGPGPSGPSGPTGT